MYIYFIQSKVGGPIKIGLAQNAKSRFKQIQACSPFELEIKALIKGDYQTEASLHKRFKETRLHGEWFSPTRELTDYIKTLGVVKTSAKVINPNADAERLVKALTMREEGKTFQQIADVLQISRQRVHQITKNSA